MPTTGKMSRVDGSSVFSAGAMDSGGGLVTRRLEVGLDFLTFNQGVSFHLVAAGYCRSEGTGERPSRRLETFAAEWSAVIDR